MIEWPQGLLSDFARRRVIIVLGSGVSRHSVGAGGIRPPTWKSFLEKALTDCPNPDTRSVAQAIETGDFLHACEWLKRRYDEGWIPYLRRTFSQPAFAAAEIHEQILKLDARIILSLNFDDIYERHANSIHHGSHIVKNYYDGDVSEFLRGDGRYIIKVHGNLNSPENLIFSQKDYSRARVRNSTFYKAFDAALLTHTFLFLGSGYNDPDINLILENQNFDFPAQAPHYFISGGTFDADRKGSLRENRNLKVIEYDPVDQNHAGLIAELRNLNSLVDDERLEVLTNSNW